MRRLQLHWEWATKAVHQIPRSKTPQDGQASGDTHFICVVGVFVCACYDGVGVCGWQGLTRPLAWLQPSVWLYPFQEKGAMVDPQVGYSEASAASLGMGDKGHTPDPPQQNPTGQASGHEC